MAELGRFVGSHSTNVVAAIHSGLPEETTLWIWPNVSRGFTTDEWGLTPRRWAVCWRTRAGWRRPITEGNRRRLCNGPQSADQAQASCRRQSFCRDVFRQAARQQGALRRLAAIYVRQRRRPDAISDCQIKRIHEYKRQLLKPAHHLLYNRLARKPSASTGRRRNLFLRPRQPRLSPLQVDHQFINNPLARIDGDP